MLKISFYVPVDQCESVKQAMFSAGAGCYDQAGAESAYDYCAWQTLGEGQFRPLDGSCPAIGRLGEVTRVAEYKVEMLCAKTRARSVVAALLAAHPYEEVAYHIVPVLALNEL